MRKVCSFLVIAEDERGVAGAFETRRNGGVVVITRFLDISGVMVRVLCKSGSTESVSILLAIRSQHLPCGSLLGRTNSLDLLLVLQEPWKL
jgi:hypothetical protein